MDKEFVRRATVEDVPFMDEIINAPEVRPLVGPGDHRLSFSPVIENNICLVSDHGAVLCQALDEATFMAVVAVGKEGRGLHAMLTIRDGLRYMFTKTECMRIIGSVDPKNHAMLRASALFGFKPPASVGCYDAIEIDFLTWALTSPECNKRGNDELLRIGVAGQIPFDLPRAFGGMMLAADNGLIGKGVAMYNTYAALSRTDPIRIVGDADRIFFGEREITSSFLTESEA